MGASNENTLPKISSTYCGSVQSLAPPQFAAVRKLGFSRVISQQRVRGNWATFFKAEIWFFALLYFNKWSTILSVPGTHRSNEIFFNSKCWQSNSEYLLCLQIVHVNKPNPKKNSTYFCKFKNKICIVNKYSLSATLDMTAGKTQFRLPTKKGHRVSLCIFQQPE